MAVMDIECDVSVGQATTNAPNSNLESQELSLNQIIQDLVNNDDIYFKNQQRGEADLTKEEKTMVAMEAFDKSKVLFLTRFGRFLKPHHLQYFKMFEQDPEIGYEVSVILQDLIKSSSQKKCHINTRNRRYEALKELIEKNSYFSEVEMMKRNPLLYEQMVGQYLTKAEKLERDKIDRNNLTFVKLLMEKIERDESDQKRTMQETYEDNAMEEEDSDTDEDIKPKVETKKREWYEDATPSSSQWGEIKGKNASLKMSYKPGAITPQERNLLRDEFVATMYESFLDGKDTDFNYDDVDNNDKYDNIDVLTKDEEEKYFDSEDPAEANMNQEVESEDELDIYMNALQQHPAVTQLSQDMKRL